VIDEARMKKDPRELGEPIFEDYFPKLTEALANFEEITNLKEWQEKRDDPEKIDYTDSRTFAIE
jgi:hypothetical protein